MRFAGWAIFAVWLPVLMGGFGRPALANGRFPAADQLVHFPERPSSLALRTTFGLLFSEDTGDTWDWVCESAVGYGGTQDPMLGAMADGVLIAGLEEGIARSGGSACSWSFANTPTPGLPIIDLSVAKPNPRTAIALAWEPASDPGAAAYRGRLLWTDDHAQSFERLPVELDPSVLMLTVDLAPSDERRVYLSGVRTTQEGRSGFLLVSRDGAKSFSAREVPFDTRVDQGVYLAAVDPIDADTVYLRTSSGGAARLIVSRDGGETFETPFIGPPVRGFALSPDGETVYFCGANGIYAGSRATLEFERRSEVRCLCLSATEDALYACSDEYSGFTVGASFDGGFQFEPKLHLKTVRGPLACADDSSAGMCPAEWQSIRSLLGIMPATGSEAGAGGDAGSSSDPEPDGTGSGGSSRSAPAAEPGGGACSFAAAAPRRAFGAGLGGLAALLLLSRRARR